MFPTVSISESQKSLSNAISRSSCGYSYILSNNKKKGFLANTRFIEFIEEEGILEQYTDWLLYKSKEVKSAFNEGHEIINSGDFSETLSFEELCKK